MAKQERQNTLVELVAANRISSQKELRELLKERGFDVTQATLSRDIRELRLIKAPDAAGRTHYALPRDRWEHTPPLARLLSTLFRGMDGTGNLVVVKTLAGGAQPVAAALDREEWPEVLGTVAGDDTILIILRDAARLEEIRSRIDGLARA